MKNIIKIVDLDQEVTSIVDQKNTVSVQELKSIVGGCACVRLSDGTYFCK